MNSIATDVEDSTERMRRMVVQQQQHPGFSMDPYFYRSHVAYRHELKNLIFRSWLYAGHISQIPNPGDFFQYEIGEDAIIVTRDQNGVIRALANSCRHRGARVCEEASGNRRTFVCPYHGWTYGGDGVLRGARHMEMKPGFDRADYGLTQLRVVVRHGLIFINGDTNAYDFNQALDIIEHALAPYRLENARIAHRQTYTVEANWKFALENYVECYHCATSHRSYARMHSLMDIRANTEQLHREMHGRSAELTGIAGLDTAATRIYRDEVGFGSSAHCARYALFDGFVTGSRDGKPVAPLMGDFKGYDGGSADMQIGPLSFMLNYPDHCVAYRFTPRSITSTDMEIVWFVSGDAVEGRDYQREDLIWLWHNTTLEDEYIISRNSAGANSHFYQPGPYQPEFEVVSMKFVEWYLDGLLHSPAAERQCELVQAIA